MTTIHQPPALDIDALMKSRHNVDVRPEGKLERRIVWNLIQHLGAAGFQVEAVNDGEEITETINDPKAAMELIFNVDYAGLGFARQGGKRHTVTLVLGNGIDIVSDWNYGNGDPDGFNAAMDTFDAEQYA